MSFKICQPNSQVVGGKQMTHIGSAACLVCLPVPSTGVGCGLCLDGSTLVSMPLSTQSLVLPQDLICVVCHWNQCGQLPHDKMSHKVYGSCKGLDLQKYFGITSGC